MRTANIQPKLFENISEFSINGTHYDLHNDYYCTNIKIDSLIMEIIFEFTKFIEDGVNKKISERIELIFSKSRVVKMDFPIGISNSYLTIDNISRGKYLENGILNETSIEGSMYFYVEFYEEQYFEFFSESVNIRNILPQ